MEFRGQELVKILAAQWSECLVGDGDRQLSPKEAIALVASGDYIGVGHHRRIMYVRPVQGETLERLVRPSFMARVQDPRPLQGGLMQPK